MGIQRGSTPTHQITTDISLVDTEVIFVTYDQLEKTVIEKTKSDIVVEDEYIEIELSQNETLKFNDKYDVEIQIRARFADGRAPVSNIMTTTVERLLKGGVI